VRDRNKGVEIAYQLRYLIPETEMRSEEDFTFKELYYSMNRLLQTQLIRPEDHGSLEGSGISLIVGVSTGSIRRGIRWRGGWLSLVEDYSRRKLTVSLDKLTALAGVAKVVAEETHDNYYAGLWGRHILEDLCWRTYPQEEMLIPGEELLRKGASLGLVSKPAEYRAPSWSWASIDGPVRFEPLSFPTLTASAISCTTVPTGLDKYGRVASGKLELAVS
jgi:hypothetical protein